MLVQALSRIRFAKFKDLLAGVGDKVPGRSDVPSLRCYLQVFKIKSREGQVERVTDAYSVIGKNLFKKETNIQAFTNLKVTLTTGHRGIIEGGFGQSGKVKVRIPGKGIKYIYMYKRKGEWCVIMLLMQYCKQELLYRVAGTRFSSYTDAENGGPN